MELQHTTSRAVKKKIRPNVFCSKTCSRLTYMYKLFSNCSLSGGFLDWWCTFSDKKNLSVRSEMSEKKRENLWITLHSCSAAVCTTHIATKMMQKVVCHLHILLRYASLRRGDWSKHLDVWNYVWNSAFMHFPILREMLELRRTMHFLLFRNTELTSTSIINYSRDQSPEQEVEGKEPVEDPPKPEKYTEHES